MKKQIIRTLCSAKKPAHLILHVTNNCNQRCGTCFADIQETPADELSSNEIKKAADHLDRLLWLEISGGEPFLRKDLADICSLFKTKSISIPTNGFDHEQICGITKKIRQKTCAELTIAVSIDGFEKTNDYIRAPGSFKKAVQTLEKLKQIEGIRVKVNTVICEKNYSEIIEFMKFIRKYEIAFHSVIFKRGNEDHSDFSLPSYDKLLAIKNEVFSIWSEYGYGLAGIDKQLLRKYQRAMYNASLSVIRGKKQIPPCLAGRHHLVIYSNGDVSFCELGGSIGNMREAEMENILHSAAAENKRGFIREKKCFCYHNCNMLDNIILNPAQYFRLITGY